MAVPHRWGPGSKGRVSAERPRREWIRRLNQELMADWDLLELPPCPLDQLADRLPPVDESWDADAEEEEEDAEASQEEVPRVHLCWSKVGRPESVGWAHLLVAFEKSCELLALWAQGRVS